MKSSDLKDLREFTSRKSWLKKPWMDFFSFLIDEVRIFLRPRLRPEPAISARARHVLAPGGGVW
ncbi:MAG: hypothetical protein A2V83_01375 [Nitrospirae bacterium RBG_16_64_22]|nr:MAG: hypothetical protein A2V83_01375 [Nitrospirae bacterium RBG_16_64_22]